MKFFKTNKKEIIIIFLTVIICTFINYLFYLTLKERSIKDKCFIWYQLNEQQKEVGEYMQDCTRIDKMMN